MTLLRWSLSRVSFIKKCLLSLLFPVRANVNRARALWAVPVIALIVCGVLTLLSGRFPWPISAFKEHLSRAAALERFKRDFEVQRANRYSSDPEKVKTLEDLVTLDRERCSELPEDKVEYYRYRHLYYMRARPQHEVDILLQALEDATRQQPWDLDEVTAACFQFTFGVYDVRVLEKIKQIVKGLEERYGTPEPGEAEGQLSQEKNHASGVVSSVLGSIGDIGLPESVDYLLSLLPSKRPENPMRWDRMVIHGALNGLVGLPPHLSIPALEEVYVRWFPDVSPGSLAVLDVEARGDLESLLDCIDAAYRKGYNEPPILYPGGGFVDYPTPANWPVATYSYGPGGIKLPYPPAVDQ